MTARWTPPWLCGRPLSPDYGVLVSEAELPDLVARLRAMPSTEVERLRYAAKQFCMAHLVTVHAQTDSMIESALLAE